MVSVIVYNFSLQNIFKQRLHNMSFLILLGAVVDGLALDLTYKKVYYTETTSDTINRMNLDGSSHEEILSLVDTSRPKVEPREIVLDIPNK